MDADQEKKVAPLNKEEVREFVLRANLARDISDVVAQLAAEWEARGEALEFAARHASHLARTGRNAEGDEILTGGCIPGCPGCVVEAAALGVAPTTPEKIQAALDEVATLRRSRPDDLQLQYVERDLLDAYRDLQKRRSAG
jgi:hypothetical protein